MRSDKTWKIELGEHRWTMFTYPRSAVDGLRLLGSVARGLQIGALGQTQDGRYVQVNGDHEMALSGGQVRRALRLVQAAQPWSPRPLDRPDRAVVVTIKRRRVITQPGASVHITPTPDASRSSACTIFSKATERRISVAGVDRLQHAETTSRQTLTPWPRNRNRP